eukprot:m.11157 g.11157  ORF g.11157 m.11157 type:complete len:97 (+) comp23031_c0_seq2:30-320(+)
MAQNKVFNDRDSCIFVLLGASGDLARKKIYPALWQLFKQNLLPKETAVIGYGRSALTQSELQAKILSHLKAAKIQYSLYDILHVLIRTNCTVGKGK